MREVAVHDRLRLVMILISAFVALGPRMMLVTASAELGFAVEKVIEQGALFQR